VIPIKTAKELEIIKEGGHRLADVLAELLEMVKPGITGTAINQKAESLIKKKGGFPSFKKVRNYGYATCLSVNDIVVHGIPVNQPLKNGDIIGIDIGMYYKSFHTDMSWSIGVGKIAPKVQSFLNTGKTAIIKTLKEVKPGNYIGDISKVIEQTIERQKYHCVHALVGHGVGKELHEDPQIPCFVRGKRENTPKILSGMVLAIEIIYNQGTQNIIYKNDDGWTITTRDGGLSGLFELTVTPTKFGASVLTISEKFAKITGIDAKPQRQA